MCLTAQSVHQLTFEASPNMSGEKAQTTTETILGRKFGIPMKEVDSANTDPCGSPCEIKYGKHSKMHLTQPKTRRELFSLLRESCLGKA